MDNSKKIEKSLERADEWREKILDSDSELSVDHDAFVDLIEGEYGSWREEQILKFDKQKSKKHIDRVVRKRKIIPLSIIVSSSAAAILIFVMLWQSNSWFFKEINPDNKNEIVSAGISQAYLEIDNGSKIVLDRKDSLLLFNDTKAKINSGKIIYKNKANKNKAREYHKIHVPRNGEYFVQLSDGTKVWINSESSLSFYSSFSEDKRLVKLTGEAFFEVAKDRQRPFIVETPECKVRVLGTKFNVKAYSDEGYTYTTLNEGKVDVLLSNQKTQLLPNQQLRINNETNETDKKQVNASLYSAWKEGRWLFKDERLEDILVSLARWYDLLVSFLDEDLKDRRFSISIDRYEDIHLLFKQMELTNRVKFYLSDKEIVVKDIEI